MNPLIDDARLDDAIRRFLSDRAEDLASLAAGEFDMADRVRARSGAGPMDRRLWPLLAAALLLASVTATAIAVGSGLINPPWLLQVEEPRPSSEPVVLVAGTAYRASEFSEPLSFVVPAFDPSLDTTHVAVAAQLGPSYGVLQIGYGCCWESWILDDQPVRADVCDPTAGTRADIPATPEAVGDWLRSSSLITVADPIAIEADGRTALRFDITGAAEIGPCQVGTLDAAGAFEGRYPLSTRVFAIPTGDDTILYVTWSDAGSLASVEQGADGLVRSMKFD